MPARRLSPTMISIDVLQAWAADPKGHEKMLASYEAAKLASEAAASEASQAQARAAETVKKLTRRQGQLDKDVEVHKGVVAKFLEDKTAAEAVNIRAATANAEWAKDLSAYLDALDKREAELNEQLKAQNARDKRQDRRSEAQDDRDEKQNEREAALDAREGKLGQNLADLTKRIEGFRIGA